MEDEKIVELFFQRNERAIEETSKKYESRLKYIAQQVIGTYPEVEECINDTYYAIWNRIPPTKPEFFFAFIAKITRRLSLNKVEYRNALRRKAIVIELTKELEECIVNPKDEPIDHEKGEIAVVISQFLKVVKQEDRELFMRRYWYMQSICYIAKEMMISESKVKTRLFRIRKKLREYLEKEGIWL
ncbi:MAG: RNA polymerase sigma factor [bacterium]|nr:RNA polymerase sigma factor [bacterium]